MLTTGLLLFCKAGQFENMRTFSANCMANLYGKLDSFDFGEHLLDSNNEDS